MSFAPNFPPFSDALSALACSVLASRVVWKSFHDSQDETVSLLKREQQCEEHFGKDNGNASCILLLQQKIVRGPTAKQGRRLNRERGIALVCNSKFRRLIASPSIACVPLGSLALLYDEEVGELVNSFLRL